jgi:hypothetical protein
MNFQTYNDFHLGDNLLHLHFLRGLARRYPEHTFAHYAHERHRPELLPLISDLPGRITLLSVPPATGLNAWRGAEGWFYGQPDHHDFAAIHLRWFARLAAQMGLESPFYKKADLLFDYPALAPATAICTGFRGILVVNSTPQSGQFPAFSHAGFDALIARLHAAGHTVYTTAPSSTKDALCTLECFSSVTDIGRLSTDRIDAIIGTPTGPMWPTFNVWNAATIKLRLLFLGHERVELTPNTVHANSLSLAPEILRDHGLL